MKYWKKMKRNTAILAILICLICLAVPVNAKTLVDVDQKSEITIEYPVVNAEFSLYKVAEITEDYSFIVTEPFEKYNIDFNTLNTDEWKDMAETLSGYVQRDKLEYMDAGTTDENGKLVFSDVAVGVYLVIGSQAQDGEFIYRCKPFLAFVPQETAEGEWNYEPVCVPKSSGDPIKLIDISVIKLWKDEGTEEQRPSEVVIQLLKNGQIAEEIVLNEDNNWKYAWEDLSSEFTWQVVEKEVPEGYKVQITQEGNIFKVVNSKEGTPEIPEKLPQTGQIWWPVPILAVAGLLFFMIGFVRRKTNNEK